MVPPKYPGVFGRSVAPYIGAFVRNSSGGALDKRPMNAYDTHAAALAWKHYDLALAHQREADEEERSYRMVYPPEPGEYRAPREVPTPPSVPRPQIQLWSSDEYSY